ncbi:retrovirus-related pol polyprotein from transposon TNT 1-94 [Tanacetum coccineum]
MKTKLYSQQSTTCSKGYAQEEGIDFEESFGSSIHAWRGCQILSHISTQVFSNLSDGRENAFLNGPLKKRRTSDPPIPTRYFYQSGQIHFRDSEKHGMEKGQSIGTPMATKPKLDADLSGEPVDQTDYRSKIGSLMYLTSSRPDIVQAYIHIGLWYPKGSGFELTAFSDADHVRWMTKKQTVLAKCTSAEAKKRLIASCAQVMWMRTQLQDYGFTYNKIPLYCDSQSAIAISCNPVQHSRTKHIHTRRPYALSWKPCQGDSLNLPDHRIHKGGDGDASFQLKSNSLPHAHAQTTKTFHKHQDSRIMKAQELKTNTSAQTLIYKIFLQIYQVYQGRLLASFQDDAKYEYVGQDTRPQGDKDDQDERIKI